MSAATVNTRPRYEWRESELHSECWCIDLLTGEEVCRYDLGDPADWCPSYGGTTEREKLRARGLDPDERIPLPTLTASPDALQDAEGVAVAHLEEPSR